MVGDRALRTVDTYRFAASKLSKYIGGVRVCEASTAKLHAAVNSVREYHGPVMARQCRTILRGGMQLAVLAEVLDRNPVAGIEVRSKRRPKGAAALSADQLRELVGKVMASEECQRCDLADPIVVLAATGLRRSELLGLRWVDYSKSKRTLTVSGKVIRAAGEGLVRVDETKTEDSARTIALPAFAADVLNARRGRRIVGQSEVIFPSGVGSLRDPENFGGQWREVRDGLGYPNISTHSFRKTLATLVDEGGLSARVGADHLGHAKVSMTQDNYMRRGQVHPEVADLLDQVISDE